MSLGMIGGFGLGQGEEVEGGEAADDSSSLDQEALELNTQQLLVLQYALQNNAIKRDAEHASKSSILAYRQQEQRQQQQDIAAASPTSHSNSKRIKKITLAERAAKQKELDFEQLLNQAEQTTFQSKATENEHRYLWMKNRDVLGF